MQELVAIALSELPLVGQFALAKHSNYIFRAALASSNLTHPSVLDKLLQDGWKDGEGDQQVREYAITRTTQTKLVADMWDARQIVLSYPLRNPLMATDVLIEALKNTGRDIALSAYCNPSTPKRARRELKPSRAADIVSSADGGYGIMRAFALVEANPWMMETPTSWSNIVQRAIAWQPETSIETLRDCGHIGETHPALHGQTMTALSVEQLLATDSVAAITAAIRRPELTLRNAVNILSGVPRPQPHIIGELVNRFGLATLVAEPRTKGLWTDGHCRAARWVAHSLHYLSLIDAERCADAFAIIDILGDSRQHWETFVALTSDWHGRIADAAKTACRL